MFVRPSVDDGEGVVDDKFQWLQTFARCLLSTNWSAINERLVADRTSVGRRLVADRSPSARRLVADR